MLSPLFRGRILLLCCCFLLSYSYASAKSVIPANQEQAIQSFVTPSKVWQNQHGKLRDISIKGTNIQVSIHKNNSIYNISIHSKLNDSPEMHCQTFAETSKILLCSKQNSSVYRAYYNWLKHNKHNPELEKIWKELKKPKAIVVTNPKPQSKPPSVGQQISNMIDSESFKFFSTRNNFYFNEIHYFLLIPVILALIFMILSLQEIDRYQHFCTNKCSLAIAITTVLLYSAKWYLLPLENLVLTDEWENLGVIRELFKTGTFLYRIVDVNGLPIQYTTLDYGPMFHIYAWFFTLAGISVPNAAAIVNCSMTTLLFPLFFIFARVLHPNHNLRFSFIIAFLFATLPTNITLSKTATTNPTLLVGLLLLAIFVTSAIKRKKLTYTNMFAICLTSITTCYTRAEGLFIIVGIVGFYLLNFSWPISNILGIFKRIGLPKIILFFSLFCFLFAPMILYYKIVFVDYHIDSDINYLNQSLIFLGNWLINILSPLLVPASIPIYLSLAALMTILRYHKMDSIHRVYVLLPGFVYLWISLIYALSSFDVVNATFFGKTYHLGPMYLFLAAFSLAVYPILQTYPLKKQYKIFALCFVLNIVGHLGQMHTDYLPNEKFQDGQILKLASEELETNAIILTDPTFATMVRFTANRDSSDLSSHLINELNGRPLYYFKSSCEDSKHIENYLSNNSKTLEKTKYKSLFKILPKANHQPLN